MKKNIEIIKRTEVKEVIRVQIAVRRGQVVTKSKSFSVKGADLDYVYAKLLNAVEGN